jgi:hypothetical protein
VIAAHRYRVDFKSVGRAKKSWSVAFPTPPGEDQILRALRCGGALGSRDLGLSWTDDEHATILAGFHSVGLLELVTENRE